MKNSTVPLRSEVAKSDQWNLSKLFTNDTDWHASLKDIAAAKDRVLTYKPAFAAPEKLTAETVLGCLQAVEAAARISEKTSHYAFLMKSVDESDPKKPVGLSPLCWISPNRPSAAGSILQEKQGRLLLRTKSLSKS